MPSAAATSAEAPLRPLSAGTPSNSPIEASHSASSLLAAACGGERGQKLGRHGPGIEIDALAPRRRGVEGRIDIIGAGLEADDVDAAALERAQEAERDGRLAAAGARRGDHEGAGHWRHPSGQNPAPATPPDRGPWMFGSPGGDASAALCTVKDSDGGIVRGIVASRYGRRKSTRGRGGSRSWACARPSRTDADGHVRRDAIAVPRARLMGETARRAMAEGFASRLSGPHPGRRRLDRRGECFGNNTAECGGRLARLSLGRSARCGSRTWRR